MLWLFLLEKQKYFTTDRLSIDYSFNVLIVAALRRINMVPNFGLGRTFPGRSEVGGVTGKE